MPELKNKNIEYKGLDIDVSIFFLWLIVINIFLFI